MPILYTSGFSDYREYTYPQMPPIKPSYVSASEQMRAYRVLRGKVQTVLEPYGINASQWAILGALFEQAEGMRPTDIATLLDVKAPLITMLVGPLFDMALINRIDLLPDKRSRGLQLSPSGRELVKEIEQQLRELGPQLFVGVSAEEMIAYHKVLAAIIASEAPTAIKL